MGNVFGHLFRISTWGESHGTAVGVVIDGCPPRIPLTEADVQAELDRRRPGQSKIVTQRQESDTVTILSGVFEGRTLGTPIAMLVWNRDARPDAYAALKDKFRPSHADYTYFAKYGIRDWRGGGRASARETVGRVAAGAVARKFLATKFGVEITAYVKQVYDVVGSVNPDKVTRAAVDSNIVRCPDPDAAERMIRAIEAARKAGDTLGGIIECVIRGVPAGWGDPVFDRLSADLAKAMLSIPATKGFEFGSGFGCVTMKGSEHNDVFRVRRGKVITQTNHSGGIQGGISNGQPILFRVAFKPVATLMREQETIDVRLRQTKLQARGRHDPCVLPRAVPIVEAMAALVLAEHALRHRAQCDW